MTTVPRAVFFSILLILSSLVLAAPATAEPSTSCEATGPQPSCTFACPEGSHLRVYVEAPGFAGWVGASASCDRAFATCSDYGACQTLSPDSVASAAQGFCYGDEDATLVACEALSPVSEGSSCSRESPDYWTCGFTCTEGETLFVSAVTTGPNPGSEWPRLHAACGGVAVYCQSNGMCEGSSDVVLYNDTGVCRAETVYVNGTCSSGATPPPPPRRREKISVGAPAHDTGPIGPYALGTPRINTVCIMLGIVCVGPVDAIPLGTTPAHPGVATPGARVTLDYTDTQAPDVRYERVGPIALPTPVPVVVCAFGCYAPGGVTPGPWVDLGVIVVVGDERRDEDVEIG